MRKHKVIQLMKLFIEKNGGKISDVKMMKLLYFTDRLSLTETGFPISYDDYFSLNRGPILSNAKSLIDNYSDEEYLGIFNPCEPKHSPKGYALNEIIIKSETPDYDYLSEEEVSFAEKIYDQMGALDDDEIVLYSHRKDICPEWNFPEGSHIPIRTEEIFQSIGMDTEEAAIQAKEIQYHKNLL